MIYDASRILNDAQPNFSTTKKEFSGGVGTEKFKSYLIDSPITIYINHAAQHFLAKKDAKA